MSIRVRKDEKEITKAMAINVRERRQDAGLSLYKLSCRVGCTPQTLVNLEHRHTKSIKTYNFESLASALGIDADELSGEDMYVEPPIMLKAKVIKNIERLSMRAGFGDDIEAYLEWRFRK